MLTARAGRNKGEIGGIDRTWNAASNPPGTRYSSAARCRTAEGLAGGGFGLVERPRELLRRLGGSGSSCSCCGGCESGEVVDWCQLSRRLLGGHLRGGA